MSDPNLRTNRLFLSALCVVIPLLLIAGLWPFNFQARNKVDWAPDHDGIRFFGNGIAFDPTPVRFPRPSPETPDPLTLEIVVKPNRGPRFGISRILAFVDDAAEEIFFLGQWRANLILKVRSPGQKSGEPVRELSADNVLHPGSVHSIKVVSDNNGTSIIIDGRVVNTSPQLALWSEEAAAGSLLLGNSPSGKDPWRGHLIDLSLRHGGGGEIISYSFRQGAGKEVLDGSGFGHKLIIPERFAPLRKTILMTPWSEPSFGRRFFRDVIVNILGFAPFGFSCLAWISTKTRRSITPRLATFSTILLGAGLSLFVELLQVYLPTRDSSLTDVICNTLGTWFGVVLLRSLRRILWGRRAAALPRHTGNTHQ